ncbi:MAG: hypothetical protein R3Y43_00190 [Alphaproteobacteria bacterium]
MNKKENKFKWENIYPNENVDFENIYKIMIHQIGQLKNTLQQLAAAYKVLEDKKE